MECILCQKPMNLSYNGKYYFCLSCLLASSGQKFDSHVYDIDYTKNYIEYEHGDKAMMLMDIRTQWVKDFLPEGSTLIDYGCGTGLFLRCLKNNYICCGYDVNESVINYAKSKNMIHRYFNDPNTIPGIFEGITLFDVLEHFENPLEEMKKLNKLLLDRGLIFISTPNTELNPIDSIPDDWRHFKPNEHLHYFTQYSLVRLAEKSGFKILKTDFRESEVRNTYENNIRCVTMVKL